MGIDDRLRKLEGKSGNRDMGAFFGKTYDALKEMDDCIGLAPDETKESRLAGHVKKYGSRETFIKNKIEQWNRQH